MTPPDGRRDIDLMKGVPSKGVTTVLRLEEVSKVALGDREEAEGEGAFRCFFLADTKGSARFVQEGR